jgi:hypothetical protein
MRTAVSSHKSSDYATRTTASVDAPVNTDTGGTGVPAIFVTTITGFFSRKLPVIFGNSEILEYQDLTEK